MKLGGEDKKKVAFLLGVLAVLGIYSFYTNFLSGPSSSAPQERPRTTASQPALPSVLAPAGSGGSRPSPIRRANPTNKGRGDEFHPVLRSKRPEDRIDPATIDPTLRLDLLAKVQNVEPGAASRNLFQFGAPVVAKAELKGPEPKILPKPQGPKTLAEAKAAEPPKAVPPPPPPINLKYYGFSSLKNGNRKTAFFLDGDEILVGAEGDMLKKRYRVVRIGVNSVMMEDTVSKSQQSLPLAEDAGGVG